MLWLIPKHIQTTNSLTPLWTFWQTVSFPSLELVTSREFFSGDQNSTKAQLSCLKLQAGMGTGSQNCVSVCGRCVWHLIIIYAVFINIHLRYIVSRLTRNAPSKHGTASGISRALGVRECHQSASCITKKDGETSSPWFPEKPSS